MAELGYTAGITRRIDDKMFYRVKGARSKKQVNVMAQTVRERYPGVKVRVLNGYTPIHGNYWVIYASRPVLI